MNKKYLLLAALPALMLGACSDDINNGGENTPPQSPNTVTLKKLDAASQANRVQYPGQTRGQKADRLQLVAKIAPVADAQSNNWSATGIAIENGKAYVSWHSNRQAATQAEAWGGAIDVIAIPEEEGGNFVIEQTLAGNEFKLNNVVATASNLYFPITSYNRGAVVGRASLSDLTSIVTIAVPGVSANAIALDGSNLRVVTGYKGGVYTVPAAFDENNREVAENIAYSETFGGKYIVGDRVLRTDDNAAAIVNLNGGTQTLDVPLVSEVKFAENYDPETGWVLVEGTEAAHYGKHTMAVDGNYTYVGAGQNGLRVYAATGRVWNNNTNTTAVTVDGDYVYAATGAGLRVYEKYDAAKDELPLYAYEVLNYDENGMAADVPGTNKPAAGTDAHSTNFVAVGGGYIFVANGQSGVYVFKLDTTVIPEKVNVSFKVPAANVDETKEIDDVEGAGAEFKVPDGLEDKEDSYFAGYTDEENGTEPKEQFKPGSSVTVTVEEVEKVLYPVYKSYTLIVEFNGNVPEGKTLADAAPATIKSKESSVEVPAAVPSIEGMKFLGWSKDPAEDPALVDLGLISVIKAGDKVEAPENENKVVLYAVWISNADASGTQGGENEKDPEPEPEPEQGGGAGDPNNGNLN